MTIDLKKLQSSRFLKHVEFHSQLESTNSRAIELARDVSLETPALIVCEVQTKGRGRGVNQWRSSQGNLTFSLIVDLTTDTSSSSSNDSIERSLLLSPVTALAVCQSLESLHREDRFEIKWPNDVFVRQRKISGILIETSQREVDHSRSMRFVIGCGINVNAPIASQSNLDTDLQIAISLFDINGVHVNLTGLLLQFVDSFASCIERLDSGDETLVEEIRSRFLLTERQIVVIQGSRRIEGKCTGLDRNGALKIRTDKGDVAVISGTVESF